MTPKISLPQNLYKKIGFSFIILTVILVVAVVYFSFSQATITVKPAPEKVSVEFTARVMPQADLASYTGVDKAVAGGIYTATVRGRQTFQATPGQKGEAQAIGEVTIINNYSKNQPLVATTRLLTPDGILFRLAETVDVPVGGQVKVKVYADQPGKPGEIGPTKFTIPGLWEGIQDKIYAESDAPMTGGIKDIKSVTQADLDRAKQELSDNLFKKAIEEVGKQVGEKISVLPENMVKEIVTPNFSAKVGNQVDEFTAEMGLKVTAIVADQDALLAIAEEKLKANVSADRKLVGSDPRSFSYKAEKYDLKTKSAEVKVYLDGGLSLKEDSLVLDKDKIAGLSKKEAEQYFFGIPSIKEVKIEFSPFWVTRIPKLRDHIKIVIE